ncbi:hypothetical protein [Amycolatopsis nigrescens]|uniref:hypothetical protein n=1 Tax=Amycolatopsis nigrescens TaxID=381445 RepID=UPI00036AFB29|nr:hypothetical protein [Amycolatopsis nigrescens]
MLTRTCALIDLAEGIRRNRGPLSERWQLVHEEFLRWAARPQLREHLRDHLRLLSPLQAAVVASRSRETTTHFAWCLLDEPADSFSFWLHEYKPQRDWRQGYADSVHNHRYHFCTTILRGGYVHERYDAELDQQAEMINSAVLNRRQICETGQSGMLLASEFHRIPTAADSTMTFLVKSRPVNGWSLSYDPTTRMSHRHVPVETRLGELTEKI